MDVLALRMTATANASSNPSPADFGCQNDVNNRTLANTTNFNHDESKNVLSLKNPIQNNDKPEKMDTVVPYSSRPLTFSTYRSYNGRARPSNNIQFKEENIPSYTDANGVVYRVSDHVYMDINKPNQPFAIAYILDFKLTKRDLVMIEVRWYYRPNEIPDGVYMPLMQDRLSENKNVANELIVLEPIIKGRELFASECKDIYPSSFIKGKCRVIHYQDILEAKHFKPFADTFFCILTYNPEARRLANTQGEIRVGPSHQAKLPPCVADPSAEQPADESDKWETCTWRYKSISDANLLTYLQAARSIAAFAGMCDRGNADDMYDAAQSDSTTIYAIDVLHDMQYDTSKALQYLVKNPMSAKAMDKKWTDDDQKKFVKGLRQYGKNFLRIRKELLAHKDTPDLVEFYYLWKKTPQAVNGRPRRRFTRPVSSNKRAANTSNANNSKKPNEQFSGGSEVDSDNNESDESSEQKTITNNANQCTNCFTTSSKDLQNGGRDNRLLCYDCRMYYKKYGELPKIASGVGCDAKKSKEMAKTLANNGVRSEESTDVKSEEVETNESTSAGNESDYQDYDQDVTDTNIEMNEDENGPRAEKRAKDPAQSNTTMNSDVNMKECDDTDIDADRIKQEAQDDSKTFKPIRSNFCVNSFIGDAKDTPHDLTKKEPKSEKHSPQPVAQPPLPPPQPPQPVSPHKIKPVAGFINGNKLRGNSPAFNHSSSSFSPKSVSFRPPSTKSSQNTTNSHHHSHQADSDLPNAMFPFGHPFLSFGHGANADPLSAFNNPLQSLMMQQHLNQMVSPNSKFAPTPPVNPAPFNFLSSSTPNSTPPPPANFQQTMAAIQQLVKAKEQQSSESTCPSPAPTYDDQLSPPLSVQIVVNKPSELIKADSNAMFVKVWDRGTNICSRTDLQFRYLPSSKYLRQKNDAKFKEHESAKATGTAQAPKVFVPQVINSADNTSAARNKPKTTSRNLQSPTTPALKQLRDIADRSQPSHNSAFNPAAFPDFSKLFTHDKSKQQQQQQQQQQPKNPAEMFEHLMKQNLAGQHQQQMAAFGPGLFGSGHSPFLAPPPPPSASQNPLFGPFHNDAFFHQLMSQFHANEKEQEKKAAAAVAKTKTPEPANLNSSFSKKSSGSSLKAKNNYEKTCGSPAFNSPANPSRPSSSQMSRQTNSPFMNKPAIASSPNDFMLAQQAAAAAMLFKSQEPKMDPNLNPLLNPQFASLFQQAAAASQQSPQSPNLMRMHQQHQQQQQQQQPRPPSQPVGPAMMANQQNSDEMRRLEMMERERLQFLAAMAAQAQLGGAPGLPPHGLPFNIPNEEALRFHFQMQQQQHLQQQQQQQQQQHHHQQQQQQQKDNQQKGSFYL